MTYETVDELTQAFLKALLARGWDTREDLQYIRDNPDVKARLLRDMTEPERVANQSSSASQEKSSSSSGRHGIMQPGIRCPGIIRATMRPRRDYF